MEFKQIQELIKTINKSSISELTVEQGDFKIVIKQEFGAPAVLQAMPASPTAIPAGLPLSASLPAPAPVAEPAAEAKEAPASANTITVKAPMIGTFYRSPSPDKPAFVSVGDEIKKGQTLCIIEAMKLFNEIESEVSGRIVKVLINDSSPVEYDQALFLVEPA